VGGSRSLSVGLWRLYIDHAPTPSLSAFCLLWGKPLWYTICFPPWCSALLWLWLEAMESSNNELKHLKLWAKINLSSSSLFFHSAWKMTTITGRFIYLFGIDYAIIKCPTLFKFYLIFFPLLLCWVGIHCGIHTGSYNISNISYMIARY
jgi:hypothetical protein